MAAQELFTTSLNTDPNKVSYWRMEGNSNDTWSTNNGSDTAITYNSGNGKFGQGAGFNGSSSIIAIPDAANLRITGAMSIVAWVKPNDTTPNLFMDVFCKGDTQSAASADYCLQVSSRKVRGIVSTGSATNDISGGTVMSNNVYHHIAMVYIPSTSFTLYLDGVQDAQTTTSVIAAIQSTTHAAAIGRDGTTASATWFNGAMDEVAIFNRALTATEISNIYNGFSVAGGAFLLNFV